MATSDAQQREPGEVPEDFSGQLFHTCTSISRHDPSPAELARMVMGGRIRLYPHREVELPAEGMWSADPLQDANWRFQLHSLLWLDRVRAAGVEADDPAILDWYERTLRSWLAENPQDAPPSDYSWFDMAVGLRAVVLAFAVDHFGRTDWLLEAAREHGEHLADPANYDERGNHGLHQDLGLLVAGQLCGRRDWIDLAQSRVEKMFHAAIDDEGVCREGSIDYQYRNYLWYQEAMTRLEAAGVGTGVMRQRLDAMPEFLAHATGPSGEYALIGDTLRHSAPSFDGTPAAWVRDRGLAPAERTKVFKAGYIFSRRRWTTFAEDPSNAYLTARFGPGRATAVHGHEDAGSITLSAFGEDLLRDSGLFAYEAGEDRLYFRGRSAHNVVDVPGRKYYPSAEAELIALESKPGFLHFTIKVVGLQGVVWHRTVFWAQDEALLVVDDRVNLHGADMVKQQWQMPAGTRTEVREGGRDVLTTTPRGSRVRYLLAAAPEIVEVVSGGENPIAGWVSESYGEKKPAPVMAFGVTGESVRHTTVITYADDAGELARVENLQRTGKLVEFDTEIGGRAVQVSVSSRGFSVAQRVPDETGTPAEPRALAADLADATEPTGAFWSTSAIISRESLPPARQLEVVDTLLAHTLRRAARLPRFADSAAVLAAASPENARDLLAALPISSRTDLLADPAAFLDPAAGDDLVEMSTSGSTGEPARWRRTRAEHAIEQQFVRAVWSRIGVGPESRRVSLRGVGLESGRAGSSEYTTDGTRLTLSMHGGVAPRHWERAWRQIVEYRPHYIEGVATLIHQLAQYAREAGLNVPRELRGVAYSSDQITPQQIAEIRDVFGSGVSVLGLWGLTERVAMAATCEVSDRYHVVPEYGFVELLRPDGSQVVDPGELGEITATSLFPRATGFVRYRTGDVAAWAAEPCTCGRGHRLLERLEGRTLATIADRDGGIQFFGPGKYDKFLRELPRFARAQFVLREPAVVEVLVTRIDAAEEQRLRAVADEVFGGEFHVRLRLVPGLHATSTGKTMLVLRGEPDGSL